MMLTDILLIAALAVFVIAWWVRKTPARRIVLIASAALAIVIGVAGYFNDRWQDAGGAFIGIVFLLGLGGVVLKNRITQDRPHRRRAMALRHLHRHRLHRASSP